jgi:hypothetical protein
MSVRTEKTERLREMETLYQENRLAFRNQTGHKYQKLRGKCITLREIFLIKGPDGFLILCARDSFGPCSGLRLERIDQLLTGHE